jgi:thiosulfate/3-mercaptopyruvate sulfurtransferase
VHLEWTALLSATGDLHGPERIRDEAHHVGLNEHDEIIVYCHSGQRSAIAGLALRAAGFANVRNSLGSWHEWSLRGLSNGVEA